VVISLGGSILVKGEDDAQFIKDIIDALSSLDVTFRFVIITGGGRIAREHIRIGREAGANEAYLDQIGIQATRLNAWLVISAIQGNCYPRPFTNLEEAVIGASAFRYTVGGGTHPGHTTDTVGALIAEMWGADMFLNLTAVDGAYTKDPNRFDDAERIQDMTTGDLRKLVSETSRGAGSHSVLDPLAAEVVHRASIRTCILDGRDVQNVVRCLVGEEFHGTDVIPGE
jgi:uridylate kinase